MKKGKILFAIVMFVCLFQIVYALNTIKGAKIEVSLISQEPDPVNPGEVVNLRFKIQNLGSSPTGNLIFEILPEYPFSVYKGSAVKEVPSLQGLQRSDEGVIILYQIKIDENAVEGEEKIDIRYKAKDDIADKWIYVKDFPVRIRTRDLVVSVVSITSSPDPVPPGKEALVTLKIKNNADSLVRDFKIKLDMASTSVPFAPVRSTTEKGLYQIEAQKEASFTFDLIADPEADGGIYKIPLIISYADETGTRYSKEDLICLRVASLPDILAVIDSTNIYSQNKAGDIVIKIVNRGLTNIKLLKVKLESSKEFEVLSQKEVYVGNIDSDDYETVEFKLDIKSKEEVIVLPIKLIYMDATNKEFEQTKNIELRIFGKSDAQKAGLVEKRNVGYIIILLIVVVGLGLYFWRKKKKAKKA